MVDYEKLEGKVAIITGASAGIGFATAEKLAEKGVKLSLASRTESKLKNAKDKILDKYDTEILTIPTNVRKEDQIKNLIEETKKHFERIDIVVNNAGIIRYGDIESLSTEDYRAMMETNVDGMFFTTREVLPHLRETKGNLIFVGSFDSSHPRSFNPIYASSKWWTKGFAHSIEAVVGKDGIAVTLINPSEVRTEIHSEDGEEYKNKFDQGEVTDPEEVAEAIVFAAVQTKTTTLSEINIYRRNKISDFF
ncbi:MAG: SDR family oxidoreductase [Thermoplasmata archaeon]